MTSRGMLIRGTRGVTLSLALTLVALTGCHKKDAGQPPPNNALPPSTTPAPTASITADPLVVDLGQSVVLNWRTTDATSVSIDGIGQVNVNGTQTVSPSNSTNFHLVARGDGGTTEANVRVTVRVPTMPNTPPGDENNANADMGSEAAFHAAVQDVFFDYDSFEIRSDAQASVEVAARYLTQHPAIKIVIGGYCDERGSAEYNLTLGENRANSAKTALVSAGVPEGRIRTVSYGKERQFCTEEDESCWQQNRRAQFMLDK
ncbi:MAG TPA: peptidoglycan-associated lipoprotein Pal [Acidobacteriaceae bacterium]